MLGETLAALAEAGRNRAAVILVTDLARGSSRLVRAAEDFSLDPLASELAARFRSGRSGRVETPDGAVMLTVRLPPPRLVVIGAVHIAQALAPMAAIAGFDVAIIDPRSGFATAERFAGADVVAEWPDLALAAAPLDPFTALAALTHDPKIDDAPLAAALGAGCFYVGALGSRKTHAQRLERLAAAGVAAEVAARIHAPIGLAIGAQSPAEIAVAILADIIAALRLGPPAT